MVLRSGGTATGSENIEVAAFDGTSWGAFSTLTINTVADAPPVVALVGGSSQNIVQSRWARVSQWLAYSDANGDAAVQYVFQDDGAGANSAYFWTPTNPHQPANTLFKVNASDLDNVWIQGGTATGSENIEVAAFDGRKSTRLNSRHANTSYAALCFQSIVGGSS